MSQGQLTLGSANWWSFCASLQPMVRIMRVDMSSLTQWCFFCAWVQMGVTPKNEQLWKLFFSAKRVYFRRRNAGGILCTWQILSFKTHITKYPVAANGNPHIDGELPIWAGFLWWFAASRCSWLPNPIPTNLFMGREFFQRSTSTATYFWGFCVKTRDLFLGWKTQLDYAILC